MQWQNHHLLKHWKFDRNKGKIWVKNLRSLKLHCGNFKGPENCSFFLFFFLFFSGGGGAWLLKTVHHLTSTVLHDQIVKIICLQHLEQLNYMRMSNFLKDFCFTSQILTDVTIFPCSLLVDYLHCYLTQRWNYIYSSTHFSLFIDVWISILLNSN